MRCAAADPRRLEDAVTEPGANPLDHDDIDPQDDGVTGRLAADLPTLTPRLPLAPLLPPIPRSSLLCVVTPIDDRGRLADRSPIRAVGWSPGQSVTISVTRDNIVIVRPDGPESITRQGHLRLLARIRHMCRLSAGDRLLVLVTPTVSLIVVYPMATLEAILRHHRTSASVIGEMQ